MTAPQNIQPNPGAADSGVAAFDAAGNETINGNLVMLGGAIVLGARAAAPVPVPGAVQLYTLDGVSVALVGAGGQAAGSTIPGNQTVNGNLHVIGTTTLGGAVEIDNNLAVFADNAAGSVMIQNGTTVAGAANADVSIAQASAGSVALATLVSGDAQNRFQTDAAGNLAWGSGAAVTDTALGRSGAGALSLTGKLAVSGLATLNGGSSTAGSAPALTPAFANGTAAQLADTTRDYMVYLQVGTAGTATTLAIGPTSTPSHTIKASSAANAGDLWTFRLPAGWFVEWAGTTTTIATQTAIGC